MQFYFKNSLQCYNIDISLHVTPNYNDGSFSLATVSYVPFQLRTLELIKVLQAPTL